MIQPNRPVQALVAELVNLLDTEIQILQLRCRQLADMGRALKDRDDDKLGNLLGEIEQTQDIQLDNELKLKAMRKALGEAFDCDRPQQMSLAWLSEKLAPGERGILEYRRNQIALLSQQLRSRHMETAMLLQECMRINRLLLEGLFGQSETVTTYGTAGRAAWQMEAGLVDTEL